MKLKKVTVPLWKRVVAYLVDYAIILFIVVQPFFFIKENQTFLQTQTMFDSNLFLISLIIAGLTLTYWTFLEYNFGQTVGKILLRIKVAGTTKNKPTVMQIVVRNLTKLSGVLLILDTLYLIFKKQGQRYFEVISKTTVVSEVMI